MFSSRRSAKCPVLRLDSEEFSGTLYPVVKKVTFLKGNLLCINVLQTFYKFCHWRYRKISNYIRICDRFCIEIYIVLIRLTSQSSNNKIFFIHNISLKHDRETTGAITSGKTLANFIKFYFQAQFFRGTQREYTSKPLKHSIITRILVFKRHTFIP